MDTLSTRLERLLNEFSAENESNTPDFILATYLLACLAAFDAAVRRRAEWYGRLDEPGQGETLPLNRVREFVGYLSGAIPELHGVEVPRLASALEAFLRTESDSRTLPPRF